MVGYSDSDWGGSVDDSKSTSGFGNGAFSWNSHKQCVVAQSSAEAEYIAANAATNQAIWLRKVLNDLTFVQETSTSIFVEKKSAIAITKNPVFHGKTKHIKVKFHAIRETERNSEIVQQHCSSKNQIANIMTKTLPKLKFETIRTMMSVKDASFKEEC